MTSHSLCFRTILLYLSQFLQVLFEMTRASESGSELPTAGPSKATRTKNGCLICRSRRIKCDLDKPECKRCITYGAECVYPEKKTFDPTAITEALQRRHASQNPPTTTSPPQASEYGNTPIPAHARASKMNDIELLLAFCQKTRLGTFWSNPVEPPDFLRVMFPEDQDLRCFHHCLTYTLSIVVVDEERNPWIEHIAPLFLFPTGTAPLSSTALKLAMLGMGATHLSYLQERGGTDKKIEQPRALSLRYRSDALKLLRQAKSIPSELADDAFLGACSIVLQTDILAASRNWREALRLGVLSISHRGGIEAILFGDTKALFPLPVRLCLVEFFVLLTLFAALSTGETCLAASSSMSWWPRLDVLIPGAGFRWTFIESFCGIDRTLLRLSMDLTDLIANTLDLRKCIDPSATAYADKLSPLDQRTDTLSNALHSWKVEHSVGFRDQRIEKGSQAFWHAGYILLLRDLRGRPRDDPEVQQGAAEILALCYDVGDKIEYMNWPLVIASSVLTNPEQRDTVRGILKAFAYQCCYEIEVAQMLVEEMWKRIDESLDDEACCWREIFVEMGYPVLFA
ncbi:fungal-specific transcription factor domain-domain-containing protein [Naematelia encephala]|uniref:Fungal-specific transcription factor domain-domain-containing protein n=1 Tax=Naematelia encephala TaxID=71784 RepID=A0A1Y2AZZ0_9TREE|nr:fungal-specific transcription factor domain-domain-containing protein [Naematelia encephala]